MTRGVEFGASFEIEDRDPVVLVNHDWTFRGKSFLRSLLGPCEYMIGRMDVVPLREDPPGEWRAAQGWRYRQCSANLDEVPGYAQRALLKELDSAPRRRMSRSICGSSGQGSAHSRGGHAMKCNEDFGCGEEVPALFAVRVYDGSFESEDDDGTIEIKVCGPAPPAATGRIEMSIDSERWEQQKAAWEWLKLRMPDEVDAALAKFVEINPHYQGAEWWDVLEILRDSDAQLDIVEPVADAIDDWSDLHAYVTLTLIYASREFAVDYTDEQRVHSVQSSIRNERFIRTVTSREPATAELLGRRRSVWGTTSPSSRPARAEPHPITNMTDEEVAAWHQGRRDYSAQLASTRMLTCCRRPRPRSTRSEPGSRPQRRGRLAARRAGRHADRVRGHRARVVEEAASHGPAAHPCDDLPELCGPWRRRRPAGRRVEGRHEPRADLSRVRRGVGSRHAPRGGR